MIASVADQPNRPRRARRPDAHTTTYPALLHGHLAGAVAALADVAAPVLPAEAEAPTPAELVERYGTNEAVNTSQNEGGENV